jgi:anaerobic ribonucleoside-triphosphate reductase
VKVKTLSINARVVGYYRPINAWNEGKRQEWKDRLLPALT